MEEREQKGVEDLECYQLAQAILKEAYALVGKLPDVERYNLADQIRRAATSVVLNIAEGYGRFHYLDRLRFLYIARGSLTETLGAFDSCQTVGYISTSEMERLRQLLYSSLRSLIDWPEGGTDVYRGNQAWHLLGRRQRPHHRSL